MRRLAIVRLGGPDDGVRRYRLARLDEIAIASPPEKARPPEAERVDDRADDDGVDHRSNRAA